MKPRPRERSSALEQRGRAQIVREPVLYFLCETDPVISVTTTGLDNA